MIRTLATFTMAALVITGAAIAQTSPYAPAEVTHALYLQTTGLLAQMAVVEPCNTSGMVDAVHRADAAYENQDVMTLQTEQNGFAVGFARCALRASSADDFATFSCATIQSATQVIDAHHAQMGIQPSDKARAHQLYVIGSWLNKNSHADAVCRSIVKTSLSKLRKLHAL